MKRRSEIAADVCKLTAFILTALATVGSVAAGKTTVAPKDCKDATTVVEADGANILCGKNPYETFVPRKCRHRKSTGSSDETVLKPGDRKFWSGWACDYNDDGDLRLLKSGAVYAEIPWAGCAGRTQAGWVDREANAGKTKAYKAKPQYSFYCEKKPYGDFVPVSCDFGGKLDDSERIVKAGSRTKNGEGIAYCDVDFKDGSVTPQWIESKGPQFVADNRHDLPAWLSS